MKFIKKAMKEAVRLEIIPRNPADKIELLADDPRERGILTPAELERLFRLEWPPRFWLPFPECGLARL
jgi:hypothetical protein